MKQLALQVYQRWRSQASDRSRNRWLAWGISGLSVGYVGWRLYQEGAEVWLSLWPQRIWQAGCLLLALLLMPINWGLEASKWQRMVARWYPALGLRAALQAVFTGLSTGIFTPNRVGEYPGRILCLPGGHRWEAASAMLIDRLIQMLITMWMGTLATWWLIPYLPAPWQGWAMGGLPWLIGGSVLLPLLLLGLTWLAARRLRATGVLGKLRQAMAGLTPRLWLALVALSLLRYLVFSSQYLLLLIGAGSTWELSLMLAAIWWIFLLKSVVPTWTVAELGVRETIAIAVLGLFGASAALAFSTTFLLYLINLVIPAIWGLRWVHRVRWNL